MRAAESEHPQRFWQVSKSVDPKSCFKSKRWKATGAGEAKRGRQKSDLGSVKQHASQDVPRNSGRARRSLIFSSLALWSSNICGTKVSAGSTDPTAVRSNSDTLLIDDHPFELSACVVLRRRVVVRAWALAVHFV